MDQILIKAQEQMVMVLGLVENDLKTIKTGRARPSLVEDLKVEAYNSTMKLKELASISSSDMQSLVVSPWDKTLLKAIEKAILVSQLHLTPAVDNDLIRIKIPQLTEETRKDLVKLVYQKLESGRKLVRQARNELKSEIEAQKGKPGISEDTITKGVEELQKQVDATIAKIEAIAKLKEQELMTI